MIQLSYTKLISLAVVSLLLAIMAAITIQERVSAQVTRQATEAGETTQEEDDQNSSEVTNNIRQLILDTASKVKGVANSDKKAMIGEVQRITDEALTIQHLDGQQIIPLAEALLMEDDEAISIEDVEVGNWVTIMGSVEEKTITPDYILISDETYKSDPQTVIVGTITELTRSTIIVQPRNEDGEKEFDITTTTDFEDPEGNDALLNDFEVDMTVLVTGFETGAATEDSETTNQENTETTASTIRSLAPLETIAGE